MSIKKLLCNPPAERQAASGDPVVQGMFEGAGQAAPNISDETLYREYTARVVKTEQAYIDRRKKLAYETENEMYTHTQWLMSELARLEVGGQDKPLAGPDRDIVKQVK